MTSHHRQNVSAASSSWEDIANEVAPAGVRPGGLATGAWRRANENGSFLSPPKVSRIVTCPPCAPDAPLETVLAGQEINLGKHGPHYRIARPAAAYDPALDAVVPRLRNLLESKQMRGLARTKVEDLLFVDIETTGLSSSVPLFLVGTMRVADDDRLQLELFLARSFGEEPSVLAAFHEKAQGKTLVTFNGKTFDWPYIEGRSERHRLSFEPPRAHFDVLHHARRLWKGETPNCRLQTLECYLCGRQREGDVPSSQIPERYHEYLDVRTPGPSGARGQGAHLLAPIIHHNVWDIVTMAELMCLIGESRAAAQE